MMSIRSTAAAATLLLLTASRPAAQLPEPARLPPPPTYVEIGDQLFDVTDPADTASPNALRPHGASVDSNAFGWRVKFQGWEGGVIPVDFAADISDAQRAQVMRVCAGWARPTPVACIPRTSQLGYLRVSKSIPPDVTCSSAVGQSRRLVAYDMRLGEGEPGQGTCWTDAVIYHELGHAFGFIHEHQRPDRDTFVTIDLSVVPDDKKNNFVKLSLADPLGPYDFLSIMHYKNNAFASDPNRHSMVANAGYVAFDSTMGTSRTPTDMDYGVLEHLYAAYLRPLQSSAPAESPRTRFDRNDFLDAMERLHAFYYSGMGLNRSGGLSINGRPDFQGIATWVFDVYLAARSRGFSSDQSFGMVVADITRTDEWRSKHVGQTPLTRPSFTPVVNFDRNEFLAALQQLDAFYSAPEGLRRPSGLSISGGPDFLGIATWLFDIYLNERLSGGSSTVAWQRVVNAIQNTDEWKSKH